MIGAWEIDCEWQRAKIGARGRWIGAARLMQCHKIEAKLCQQSYDIARVEIAQFEAGEGKVCEG